MKSPDFYQHCWHLQLTAGLDDLREQMGMPSANCRYASWDEVPGLSHLTDEDYEAIKALTLESQYEGWWLEDRDYLEFLLIEDSKSSK